MTLEKRIARLEAKMPPAPKASGYGLRLSEMPEADREIVIGMLTASDGTAEGDAAWARYYALMDERKAKGLPYMGKDGPVFPAEGPSQ